MRLPSFVGAAGAGDESCVGAEGLSGAGAGEELEQDAEVRQAGEEFLDADEGDVPGVWNLEASFDAARSQSGFGDAHVHGAHLPDGAWQLTNSYGTNDFGGAAPPPLLPDLPPLLLQQTPSVTTKVLVTLEEARSLTSTTPMFAHT